MELSITKVESISQLNDLAAEGRLQGLFDVPIEVYHAGPGISSSGLKEVLRSPAHFHEYRSTPKDTASLRLGRITHIAVLEPDVFKRDFSVPPQDIDRRTTAGKAAWGKYLAESVGKITATPKESETSKAIASAIASNRLATRCLVENGVSEVSAYWTDEATGVLCRARADRLAEGAIFDLKTCQDARLHAFQRDIVKWGYHLSAAFYKEGFDKILGRSHTFGWIAVESPKPHGIAFHVADAALLEPGRDEFRQALKIYRDEILTKPEGHAFTGYPQRFESATLPAWYY